MDAPVTREGELIFFAQFLKTGERWKRLFKQCPLEYIGNQGSGIVNTIGTAVLSILLRALALCSYQRGKRRYTQSRIIRDDQDSK